MASWSTPRDWSVGETLTAANMDTYISDNLTYLYDYPRNMTVTLFEYDVVVTTGDYANVVQLGESLDGYNLTKMVISCYGTSSSGNPTVQAARGRQAAEGSAHSWLDIFSTRPAITSGEFCSLDGTAGTVNTDRDDVEEGDLYRFDVDTAGTGTDGLWATLSWVPQ